jgi:hypothetical protein
MVNKKSLLGILVLVMVLIFGMMVVGCGKGDDSGGGPPGPGEFPPGFPTDLKVTETSSNSITLSWDSVRNADGYNIYRNNYYLGEDDYDWVGSTSETSWKDDSVMNFIEYYYVVTANLNNEEGKRSISVRAKAGSITAISNSSRSITVSWDTAPTSFTSGDNNYRFLYYRIINITTDGEREETIYSNNTKSFLDTGLSPSTIYFYLIRAYYETTESIWLQNDDGSYYEYVSVYSQSLEMGEVSEKTEDSKIGFTGPGGGIVFYYSEEGFYMTDNAQLCHYLEAAPVVMEISARWSTAAGSPYINISNTGMAIGAGRRNTTFILSLDPSAPAALTCSNFGKGGGLKEDWFLPSLYELDAMLSERSLLGITTNVNYWSSSQYNTDSAYYMYATSSYLYSNSNTKGNSFRVRAIRAY